MTSFASGKLFFKPYKNSKADTHSVMMGLSVYQKFMGPFQFKNWTGLDYKALDTKTAQHKLMNVHFNNSVGVTLMGKADIDAGVELHKDIDKGSDIAETYFVKISAQIW
jgi:hypothetical protein